MNSIVLAEDWKRFQTGAGNNRDRIFNKLIELHGNDLKRYAYWLAGDKPTAEDLLQEALLRVCRGLAGEEMVQAGPQRIDVRAGVGVAHVAAVLLQRGIGHGSPAL